MVHAGKYTGPMEHVGTTWYSAWTQTRWNPPRSLRRFRTKPWILCSSVWSRSRLTTGYVCTCVVNKGDKKNIRWGSLEFFLDIEIRVFFLMSQSSQMLVGDEKKGLDRFWIDIHSLETSMTVAPGNGWLEDDRFLLGWLPGRCFVSSGSVYIYTQREREREKTTDLIYQHVLFYCFASRWIGWRWDNQPITSMHSIYIFTYIYHKKINHSWTGKYTYQSHGNPMNPMGIEGGDDQWMYISTYVPGSQPAPFRRRGGAERVMETPPDGRKLLVEKSS